MSDLIKSGLKTAIQALLALVLAAPPVVAILSWMESVGFTLDVTFLEEALFGIAAGVVAVIMNWLSQRFPTLGRFLGGTPHYETPEAPPAE